MLAVDGLWLEDVSQLAAEIQTSRATVMNYIKYLADARLINMVYPKERISQETIKIDDTQYQSDVFHLSGKVDEQDVQFTFL